MSDFFFFASIGSLALGMVCAVVLLLRGVFYLIDELWAWWVRTYE